MNTTARRAHSAPDATTADPAGGREADDAIVELREALVYDLDEGFARLVGAHQAVAYSVALRTTGHRADAEDLLAESLLRAYRALRGYDATRLRELQPRPWLLTIVVNTRRNQVRDAARRPRADGAEPPDRPSTERSVEDRAQDAETSDELAAQLARLTDVQRTAVVLRHVVDLPIDEVAEVLGCPPGTAKSHVSRGLSRLRALMTPPDGVHTAATSRSNP
ncbi:RNA polymerase sigma-70 factor (ECF subfamily) [Actinomycetospora succinea]|uniref:RNA polymerase sigma-70 factor (ECF subfamily) n=1 Tax=Actinomycetospora succinea TaxID=663603 RepID=A0A4R6VXB9_9PSEU|nr:sigma-70 family RNA polymerase sigma factor [Actinomycetospora succinea]TDQ65195.1 RNA polymerase sigma-70 factor (ECF subfamily) [Actinomycetospora succinea]